MKVVALLLLLAAAAVAARRLRGGDGPRRGKRPPKPGQGMTRYEPGLLTTGMVAVATLPGEEAIVARGLLDSAGIPAYAEGVEMAARTYQTLPSRMRVVVPPERADEARALLRGEGT